MINHPVQNYNDQVLIESILARVKSSDVRLAHQRLHKLMADALNQFRLANDVPGVRYWEVYFGDGKEPQRMWHTTMLRPEDPAALPRDAQISELSRLEFLARVRDAPAEKPTSPYVDEDDEL